MASSKYEVILQQDVTNLGKSGEVVRVRPGFARNFLIPQKIAVASSARNRALVEHQKRVALARAAKDLANAEAVAKRLSEVSVTIPATAGEEERLYGAVTTRDISTALAAQGVTLDHKSIRLVDPIKRLGSYDVNVKLGGSMTATFKVNVVKK
ncbi:MAG: 50S ribosomal protein L9 [Deltaproteobacteria bacterium]|nr:50S ribosomal protein L9 [Deltaproteobacteria bacterium]